MSPTASPLQNARSGPAGTGTSAEHDPVLPADIATGVVIGRASEYFDYFVYGIASVLVFPQVYFPDHSRLDGTLWSFALFALAFIARPVGTLLFMQVQRRYGIGPKMTIALFMLGTATAGIAFLPTHAKIGSLSVVLLGAFRVMQGIATAGAWDGLPSLLALKSPAHRKGWYAMLGQLGAPIGFLIAVALFCGLRLSLSPTDFIEWGWRYPFFVAFALNVVALFARLRLVVAPEYDLELQKRELVPVPNTELLTRQSGNIVLGAFGALAGYALFHLVTIFPLSWIQLYASQPISEFLMVQMAGAVLAIGAMFVSGRIADRYGRRQTVAAGAVLVAIFSGFAPTLLDGGTVGQDIFVLVGFTLLGLVYAQTAGVMNDAFEPRYRYSGAALTNDLAWLIGAGFAPAVALGLSAHFGLFYVSLYLLSGAFWTFFALMVYRRHHRPDGDDGPG